MHRRPRRRRIAWIVIAALVMQPWLGLFATANAAQQTNAFVICTGSGFKVITMPGDGGLPNPSSDQRSNHGSQSLDCAACLVQALVRLGSAAAPGVEDLPEVERTSSVRSDREPSGRTYYSPLQSRAPPAS